MKIEILQTSYFIKTIAHLFKKRQLLEDDFDLFLNEISQKPDKGDVISGTNGVRKIRLKSATKGKRGGFRVCYYYAMKERIYLLTIYAKNEQEDLLSEDKKVLKELVAFLKRGSNE